jgi:hypothetical protein
MFEGLKKEKKLVLLQVKQNEKSCKLTNVVDSYTVINPRTVMMISRNAESTYKAMKLVELD